MARNSLNAALPKLSPMTLSVTTLKKTRLAPRGRTSFDAIPVGEVADRAEWAADEVGTVDVTPRPAKRTRQENAAIG
jgi:hypothetical protein